LNIAASLRQNERQTGMGYAFADNAGFRVNLPNRESFNPEAAFHTGSRTGMRFLEGAPIFAVEIRSEGDYGPAAERALAEKRGQLLVNRYAVCPRHYMARREAQAFVDAATEILAWADGRRL
jgi:Uma2 family endonuclease